MSGQIEPIVFIGMPIWNCEETLEKAIQSVVNQEYKNWRLFISDNFSTDSSWSLALRYSQLDSRVTVIQQSVNIGAEKNFCFVLEKSYGDFFKFHASDDVLSPDYLSECVISLIKSDLAVGACTTDGWDWEFAINSKLNSFSLSGPQFQRFYGLRKNCWKSNGIFYGVYRRKDFLCAALPILQKESQLAPDWLILARLVKVGEIVRTLKGHLILGSNGISSSDPFHWWNQLTSFSRKLFPYKDFVFNIRKGDYVVTFRSQIQITAWVLHLYYNHYKGLISIFRRALKS